jgi:phosphoglycerate dehydrogenase-like enzyme
MVRAAILDDYQNVAMKFADWSAVSKDVDVKVFNDPIGGQDAVIRALQGFAVVVMMRERTPFPRQVIESLPDLKLLITTGARNNSIDLKACAERGVTVCGTGAAGSPTAGIAFGLMLEITRRIGFENARLKAGLSWQVTIGQDLEGLTLGIVGFGKLGQRVARIGNAFGMKVIAWSQNLTPEKAKEGGAEYVSKDDLFRTADFISIHYVLGDRSRGLVSGEDIARMKPTACLINTARAPNDDQAALLKALQDKKIGGAGLDVFDVEPLPLDHPFRKLDNVVLTPHLGYVSEQNYRK